MRLRTLLGRRSQGRPDWGIRVLYARDPTGHLLELNQSLAER